MNTQLKSTPPTAAKSIHPKLKRTSRAALKTAALSLAAAAVICGGAGMVWGTNKTTTNDQLNQGLFTKSNTTVFISSEYTDLLLVIIPSIAVLVSIITLIIQVRNSSLSMSINNLLELETDFYDSPKFLCLRKEAAKILKELEDKKEKLCLDKLPYSITEILGFLDLIGHLYAEKAIKRSLIESEFEEPIVCYWHKITNILKTEEERKEAENYWKFLFKIRNELIRKHPDLLHEKYIDFFFNNETHHKTFN